MVELSAEIIKKSIEPGSVVTFVNPKFSSDLPHMYVVVNDPSTMAIVLVMVNFTSQVESRKRARSSLPATTLVELDDSTCSFLCKKSIVDCNSPTQMTIEELVKKNGAGELRLLDNVDDSVLIQLQKGIADSPLVSREIKKLVAMENAKEVVNSA